MAKKKAATKRPPKPGGVPETEAEAEALNAAGIGVEEEPREAVAKAPSQLPWFEVEIPLCLLGIRHIQANSGEDAIEQYKQLGGINATDHIPKATQMPDDWTPDPR